MTWKKDEEITELINRSSKKQRSRVTITRWRNKSRYPNYEEVREIEKNLGIPFDVLYRDVNLDELMEELQRQLKEVKRIKKFISELNANKLLTEIECSLPLGDYIIRGVIDLLAIYDDRIEIIDYKTDVSKHNHSEYVKQLSVYYHAVKEYYNKKTVCKIYYVSSDEVVEVEPLNLEHVIIE